MIVNEKVEYYLPTLQSNSVDVIIADPPFNKEKKYDGYDDNMKEEDYWQWVEDWICQGFRILKSTGTFWMYCPSSMLNSYETIGRKYGVWQNTIVWKYANPTPDTKRFSKTWSSWLLFSKEKVFNFYPKFYKELDSMHGHRKNLEIPIYDVWNDIPKLVGGFLAQSEVVLKSASNKERIFVYQLPIALLRRIIGFSSKEGDLIMDLFTHSGTASVAAELMKRKWIAVEQSSYYCGEIEKRIKRIRRSWF